MQTFQQLLLSEEAPETWIKLVLIHAQDEELDDLVEIFEEKMLQKNSDAEHSSYRFTGY